MDGSEDVINNAIVTYKKRHEIKHPVNETLGSQGIERYIDITDPSHWQNALQRVILRSAFFSTVSERKILFRLFYRDRGRVLFIKTIAPNIMLRFARDER